MDGQAPCETLIQKGVLLKENSNEIGNFLTKCKKEMFRKEGCNWTKACEPKYYRIKVSNEKKVQLARKKHAINVKNQVLGVAMQGEIPTPMYSRDKVDILLRRQMFVQDDQTTY